MCAFPTSQAWFYTEIYGLKQFIESSFVILQECSLLRVQARCCKEARTLGCYRSAGVAGNVSVGDIVSLVASLNGFRQERIKRNGPPLFALSVSV